MSLDKHVPGPFHETRFFEGLKTSEKFNSEAQKHLETISYWSRTMSTKGLVDWIEHQSFTREYKWTSIATPEDKLLQNLVFKALLEPLGKEVIVPNTASAINEMKALLDHAEVNSEAYLRSISERLGEGNLSETEILASLQALAKDLGSWLDDN